jgi:hypothetical protein
MAEFKALIKLVKHKHKFDQKKAEPKYMDNKWLLGAIDSELKEVQKEIKPNNIAHLEDELSGILHRHLTIKQI